MTALFALQCYFYPLSSSCPYSVQLSWQATVPARYMSIPFIKHCTLKSRQPLTSVVRKIQLHEKQGLSLQS